MTFLFILIFCCLSIVFSILIVISKNPVHSILYLILVFCNVSFIFLILNIEFVAIVFLIVYVGAIAVLFLFVVMMLNIKIVELDTVFWRYAVLGFSIILLFLSELFLILFDIEIYSGFSNSFSIKTLFFDHRSLLNFPISEFVFVKNKEMFTQAINFNYTFSNTELLGWYVYTYGIYIFFLLGLILLTAMIGSIVLVLNQNVNIRRQFIFKQILRELKSSVVLKK